MKVLNIPTNGLRREGINSMLLRWIRMMDKTNLQMDVAAVRNNAIDVINEYKSLGCEVFILPDRTKSTTLYMVELYKLLQREKYDAIHVHGSSGIIGIELFIAKITGIKVRIAHSRNTLCNFGKIDSFLRPIMKRSMTHALACSVAAGKWLFGDDKFEVMHNGIDASTYKFNETKRREIRMQYEIDNYLVLGFVGNIKDQKNPLFLIEIFAEIHKRRSDSVLLIVGDGDMRIETENMAKKLEIERSVFFIGRSDHVSDYMQAMDIFLFPSLFEGFGNVALEAQISGLPVFASNQIPDDCKLTDLVTFLPISEGVDIWADTILNASIMSCDARSSSYKRTCEQMAKGHFDLSENVKRLREIYSGR